MSETPKTDFLVSRPILCSTSVAAIDVLNVSIVYFVSTTQRILVSFSFGLV